MKRLTVLVVLCALCLAGCSTREKVSGELGAGTDRSVDVSSAAPPTEGLAEPEDGWAAALEEYAERFPPGFDLTAIPPPFNACEDHVQPESEGCTPTPFDYESAKTYLENELLCPWMTEAIRATAESDTHGLAVAKEALNSVLSSDRFRSSFWDDGEPHGPEDFFLVIAEQAKAEGLTPLESRHAQMCQ